MRILRPAIAATLMGLLIVACAAPQAAEAQATAWGQERDGLQVGFGFASGKRAYRFGETVAFTITVRNVGKEPVTLALKAPSGWRVGLSAGRNITLTANLTDTVPFSLEPGGERTFPDTPPRFALHPPGNSTKAGAPVLPLAPGRYTVRAPYTLWTADAEHPGFVAGLKAQPGTLDLEVVGNKGDAGKGAKPVAALTRVWENGKARRAGTIPPSWGETVNGLQAGLAFHDLAACCPVFGEKVAFDLYLRNASGRPLTILYSQFRPYDSWPIVKNATGESVRVLTNFVGGKRGQATQTLQPGEAVIVSHPELRIARERGPDSAFDTLVDAAPGKYIVELSAGARFPGAEDFGMAIPACPLELVVEEK